MLIALTLISPDGSPVFAEYDYTQSPHAIHVSKIGSTPAIGTEHSKAVGEAIYTRYDYKEHVVAIALADAVVTKASTRKVPPRPPEVLKKGSLLYAVNSFAGTRYCVPRLATVRDFANRWLCLRDSNGDGVFDAVDSTGYAKLSKKDRAAFRLRYELSSAPLTSGPTQGFRQELLYQGAGGGILRITYREFKDDFARPAFSQDLTYDLAQGEATDVVFRSARVRVLSAGNEEIRYVVLAGLGD